MSLEDQLVYVRRALADGFRNEAAVSQGAVLPILQKLDWPVFNPKVVAPEYALEARRVDYALCHPGSKPRVFIEVKQVGQTEGADRQLFEYAFHVGVPMAVLTDGQEWHFYLPAEQGSYQERRVYKLDLLERDIEECANRLRRYLSYESVCSGEYIRAAQQDYQNVAKERQIVRHLPIAWAKLIQEKDELLVELIADKVESLCGYKPDEAQVRRFLSTIDQPEVVSKPKPISLANPDPKRPRGRNKTTHRMSARVEGEALYVSFREGASQQWTLPEKSDKRNIRKIRDEAVRFAAEQGATLGQKNAVKKALTDAKYWLNR